MTQSSVSAQGEPPGAALSVRNLGYQKEVQSNVKEGRNSSASRFKEPEDEVDMLLESYAIHEEIPNQKGSLLVQGKSTHDPNGGF